MAELYNKVGTEKDVTPIIVRLQTIYDNIQSYKDGTVKYILPYDYCYYENEIVWYLALAYIKDNNFNKAKELLTPLAENGDEEATKLLTDIKSR